MKEGRLNSINHWHRDLIRSTKQDNNQPTTLALKASFSYKITQQSSIFFFSYNALPYLPSDRSGNHGRDTQKKRIRMRTTLLNDNHHNRIV
mmetsp:Transcript_30583/g.46319  ORF Transcript_30583/g.46319 Transcript_30583/m.46319 type:complete len:91 (-) Transcript_30583:31-303(-)